MRAVGLGPSGYSRSKRENRADCCSLRRGTTAPRQSLAGGKNVHSAPEDDESVTRQHTARANHGVPGIIELFKAIPDEHRVRPAPGRIVIERNSLNHPALLPRKSTGITSDVQANRLPTPCLRDFKKGNPGGCQPPGLRHPASAAAENDHVYDRTRRDSADTNVASARCHTDRIHIVPVALHFAKPFHTAHTLTISAGPPCMNCVRSIPSKPTGE